MTLDQIARLARHAYDLHRAKDLKRRQRGRVTEPPMPAWDALSPADRRVLIERYRRARRQYDAGRRQPREVRIA